MASLPSPKSMSDLSRSFNKVMLYKPFRYESLSDTISLSHSADVSELGSFEFQLVMDGKNPLTSASEIQPNLDPRSESTSQPSSTSALTLPLSSFSSQNNVDIPDTSPASTSSPSTLGSAKGSPLANNHHYRPIRSFYPLEDRHLNDLYTKAQSVHKSEEIQTTVLMLNLSEVLKRRESSFNFWVKEVAEDFMIAHRKLSRILLPMIQNNWFPENYQSLSTWKGFNEDVYYDRILRKGGSTLLNSNTPDDTIKNKWRVLSLFNNPQCLGCIAFTDATTNIETDNTSPSSTLLKVELLCLLILLGRQIDPQRVSEHFQQAIKDDEKGNGWIERSAVTIFLTQTHFRVVEARLKEGTWDQVEPVGIHFQIRKSTRWDELESKLMDNGENGNKKLWKELIGWSLLSEKIQ